MPPFSNRSIRIYFYKNVIEKNNSIVERQKIRIGPQPTKHGSADEFDVRRNKEWVA